MSKLIQPLCWVPVVKNFHGSDSFFFSSSFRDLWLGRMPFSWTTLRPARVYWKREWQVYWELTRSNHLLAFNSNSIYGGPHVRMSTSRGNKLAKPLGRTGRCSCFQFVPIFLAPVYPLGRGFGPRSSQNTGIAWIGWGQTPAWIFFEGFVHMHWGPLKVIIYHQKVIFPRKSSLFPRRDYSTTSI